MDALRESFLKTYANVPANLRSDIILVQKELGPMSWLAVYLEVKNNSPMSEKMLKELRELKLI